jgi:DNA-binding SARP family transcriptional activator
VTQSIPQDVDRGDLTASRFFTLGRVGVEMSGANEDGDALATQTKQLAVLAYLCVARPRGMRQRDDVATMFWPELSQDRARAALRGAIHKLRRALGADALVGVGDEKIGVDTTRIWCDATAIEEAVEATDFELALLLYSGDFLQGVYVADTPEFEAWVERERTRLRAIGRDAAIACVRGRYGSGKKESALAAARAALEIDPYHDPSLRLVIQLMTELGDRSGALVESDRFESQIGADLGAVLAPETRDLVQRLRAGLTIEPLEAPRAPQPAGRRPKTPDKREPAAAPPAAPRERRLWRPAIVAAVLVVAGVSAAVMRRGGGSPTEPNASKPETSIYLGRFESLPPNDSTARLLSLMASDWIGRGLSSEGGPRIKLTTGRALGRDSALAEAASTGAELAVVGRVYRDGAKLVVGSELVRVNGGAVVRSHPAVPVAETALVVGADSLRRLVMSSVATAVDLPGWGRETVNPHLPSYEAYRAYVGAREATKARDIPRAIALFERATELDSGFTDALRWLIAMRSATGHWSVADSMLTVLERRNRAEPRAVQLSDAVLRARLGGGDKYEALQPLYVELGVPKSAEVRVYEEGSGLLFARRVREAQRVLLSNPAAGSRRTGIYSYWITLGQVYHELGDYQGELDVARRGLEEFPAHLGMRGEEVRALAALGRSVEVGPVLDAVAMAPRGPGTWSAGSVYAIAAREARAHGLPAVEAEARRRMIAWASSRTRQERENETLFFGVSALLYGAAAWPELAAQSDLRLAGDSVTMVWHGNRGIAAAMVGDTARARREDAWLAGLTDAQLRRGLSRGPPVADRALLRGLIAGALGDKRRAIDLLREAVSRGCVVDVELHTDPIIGRFADEPAVKDLMAIR